MAILSAWAACLLPSPGWSQTRNPAPPEVPTGTKLLDERVEQPDAQRIQSDLSSLLDHYPPTLRPVLRLDPSLLSNQPYLAAYPALARFVSAHPEILRNPTFYLGVEPPPRDFPRQEFAHEVFEGLATFAGFGMAIWLLTWLIRTFIDYRRWLRLAKVQSEVHAKLLDRFTANDDLLAYIQSPAGSKFLQSSPIALDSGARSVAAPMGRILWSVQAGVVIVAAGFGLVLVSSRVFYEAAQAMRAMGVLSIALGLGFVTSAVVSFMLSRQLGLIEPPTPARPADSPNQ